MQEEKGEEEDPPRGQEPQYLEHMDDDTAGMILKHPVLRVFLRLLALESRQKDAPRMFKGDFQTRQCTRSGVSEAVGGLLCVLSQTLV